jgi:hypothetical protein
MRALVGFLLGLVAGGLGVYLLVRRAPAVAPTVAPAPAAPDAGRPRHRRPGAARAPASDEVRPEDLQPASAGDALRADDSIDMATGGEARALGQAEIDGTVAGRAEDIIRCIRDARGAAPVAGRVVAGMVVDATGRVIKTRVEAPAYLIRHGLYDCARRPLGALRFPAAGRETVITVPFDVSE